MIVVTITSFDNGNTLSGMTALFYKLLWGHRISLYKQSTETKCIPIRVDREIS